MYKSIVLLFFAIHCSLGDRTFSIVLDTTDSMKEELYIIKANLEKMLNSISSTDFVNFALVSFKDTGTPNIFTTTNAFTSQSNKNLITHLNHLTTKGGNRCPENSLAGIEAALRTSQEKQSVVFVFTDAYAKDYDKFDSVERLCKESHSQVIIFLSGYCSPSNGSQEGDVEVYYKLAKSCPGALLRFEFIFDLRQAFKVMKEVTNIDWTDVTSHDFLNFKTFTFTVDSFTTDFMLVITGENPSLQMTLNSGFPGRYIKLDSVLQTKYAMVVRLPNPVEVGNYTANIRGQGMLTVTVYERNFVPFEFGFSTKVPRNLRETSTRPIPGLTNYILINVDRAIKLRWVEWVVDGDDAKQILLLRQHSPNLYVGSIYVHPDKMFRFWIVGDDTDTHQKLKSSSKFLSPQKIVNNVRNLAPKAEILDEDLGLIDYNTTLILASKVAAYPRPNIQWKDLDGNYLTSEDGILEIPDIYISYVTIKKVSQNSTITCYAENVEGTTFQSIDIFVNRTLSFDVIQSPTNVSVEYESSHQLYCQVDAYPEASISWYLNDTLIDSYNSRITFEDNGIMINKMDFEDVGVYECRATNEFETRKFPASVQISGLETPQIETTNTELTLKLGDSAGIECRVTKGKPAPTTNWKYKTTEDYDFKDLPFGVTVNGDGLQIDSVEKSHVGLYRCMATNIMGSDTVDFNVNIKYLPIIKNVNQDNNMMVVNDQSDVRISCEVEAVPEATVRWEFRRSGDLVPFDQDHRTDEMHNHYFTAKATDSGEYHCIAENDVGKTEKIVTVHVQVPPYIMAPQNDKINARVGANVDLICNVLVGSPVPTIRWEFQEKDTAAQIELNRGSSTLHLKNLSQYDEGTYICFAENVVNYDIIRYHVVIQP